MLRNKGQVWSTDFALSMVMFIALVLLSINILSTINATPEDDSLYKDAVHLSSDILTEGSPSNWTSSNVIIPGLVIENLNNRIDPNKLVGYDNLTYSRTKVLFHLSNEYLFFFSNSTSIINITKCVRGYVIATDSNCTPLLSTIKYKDLVKIERIVVLNSTLMTMTIYVWR